MTRSRLTPLAISAACILWVAWLDPPSHPPVQFRHDRHADRQGLCVIDALANQAGHMIGSRTQPTEVAIPARAMTSGETRRTLAWYLVPGPVDILVAAP